MAKNLETLDEESQMGKIFLLMILAPLIAFGSKKATPIVSAQQYLNYLKMKEDFPKFSPPETVIMIYSRSLLEKILKDHVYEQGTSCFSELFLINDGKVAVFYVQGHGASPLLNKMEELIAFGVKKFISVGYAGGLTNNLAVGDWVIYTKALSEDGAGYLYMNQNDRFAYADSQSMEEWQSFMKAKHPNRSFKSAVSWSFPVLAKETREDVQRVTALGCTTVEMEIAAFFAITQEKKLPATALCVISDSLANEKWDPHIQDLSIKESIKEIVDLAIEFSQNAK